jgi:hypothetical protein
MVRRELFGFVIGDLRLHDVGCTTSLRLQENVPSALDPWPRVDPQLFARARQKIQSPVGTYGCQSTVTLGPRAALASRDKYALDGKAALPGYGGASLTASTYIDPATAASSGTSLQRAAESTPQMPPKPDQALSGLSLTGSHGRRTVGLQM